MDRLLRLLNPFTVVESLCALWKEHVPDWIRRPIEGLFWYAVTAMLGWLIWINDQVAEWGAFGYVLAAMLALGTLFWLRTNYLAMVQRRAPTRVPRATEPRLAPFSAGRWDGVPPESGSSADSPFLPAPDAPGPDLAAPSARLEALIRPMKERPDDPAVKRLSERLATVEALLWPHGQGLIGTNAVDGLVADLSELRDPLATVGEQVANLAARSSAVEDGSKLTHEATRTLRHWLAAVARVQLDATKTAMLGRLVASAPTPPTDGEAASVAELEQFSREANSYLAKVNLAAGGWALPEHWQLPYAIGSGAAAAERELESAGPGLRLDAASFGALRRYKIASRQIANVGAFIDRQRALMGEGQETAISELLALRRAYEPRFGDD